MAPLSAPAQHKAMAIKIREVAVTSFSATREAEGIEATYQELWNRG